MHSFTRLTSFLFFVLSLSFLTCALPTQVAGSKDLVGRDVYGQQVLDLVVGLEAKVLAHKALIDECTNVGDVVVKAKGLIVDVTIAAQAVKTIGANIDIEREVKAAIGVKVASILLIVIQICLSLTTKFGVAVLVVVFAKIDLCTRLLLVNLEVCVNGIIPVIVALSADLKARVLARAQLTLCQSVLGL